MKTKAGHLVETKEGKRGRTYHSKGLIQGKVPVYLETGNKFEYEKTGLLCELSTIKIIGCID